MDNYTQAKTRVLWEKNIFETCVWGGGWRAVDSLSALTMMRAAPLGARLCFTGRAAADPPGRPSSAYIFYLPLSETSFQGKWKIWALITIIKKSKFTRSLCDSEWEALRRRWENFPSCFPCDSLFIFCYSEEHVQGNVPARRLANLLKVAKCYRKLHSLETFCYNI